MMLARMLAIGVLPLTGCIDPGAIDVLLSLRLPSHETKQLVLHCAEHAPVGECAITAGAVRVSFLKRTFR